MIDIEFIRQEPEKVKKGIASKNIDSAIVDKFLKIDEEWRKIRSEVDYLRSKQKKLSDERSIEEAKKNKEEIKAKEDKLLILEEERDLLLRQIPNLPLGEVPLGKDEKDNIVLREVGEKPKFNFPPKDYLTLAQNLNLIDVKRAAKTSGNRFGFLVGDAVLLEFALVDLVLKVVTNKKIIHKIIKKNRLTVSDNPFVPVIPPVLVNRKSMSGMGYLERGEEEIYYLPKDNLYLVGTSEQSIGPMHQDELFEEQQLPLRYLGFSTCFRREAGSYGKDTKGIFRVHQFDKLEMFSFALPEKSRSEHRLLLAIEEYLMQMLELPYRVLNICTGDLGDSAAAKFDIEVWLPGQNNGEGEYRETHSTSNTTDFQARRLNIKYRELESKKQKFVHLLNGTAFAIGRAIIAIIENYQTKDGRIIVPKVLQKYVGKEIIG